MEKCSRVSHTSCVLRLKSVSRKRKEPAFFLPFIPENMAEEEVAAHIADNESGMCKVGFLGDEAPCVDNDSGKAGFASDDAPRAVPLSVSTLTSPATSKRRKWVQCV